MIDGKGTESNLSSIYVCKRNHLKGLVLRGLCYPSILDHIVLEVVPRGSELTHFDSYT